MDQIKSSSIYIQVVVAALLYNLLHILAWELPIAIQFDWKVNIIGDMFIIIFSTLSIILVSLRKKTGLILAMIPAVWAIFIQWFIVYIAAGYKEPYGVWWYPVFPIFQGIMIVYFSTLAYKDNNLKPDNDLNIAEGLKSPSIYLHAVGAFLLVQTGQKAVREMVVGFRQHGPEGFIPVVIITLITIITAIMVIRRMKKGLIIAIILGSILLMQPIIYHIIMGKPCLGGIWWYPIYTAIQGAFIVYFSTLAILNKKK